jgi:predicted flap endonuclease-1-like 5' DNA nuclease
MIISILMTVNIFNQDVLKKYTGEDATMEILLMLFASALLGFLLRHFLGYMSKKEIIIEADSLSSDSTSSFLAGGANAELGSLRAENEKLKRDLSACLDSYKVAKLSIDKTSVVKKSLVEKPTTIGKSKVSIKKPVAKSLPITKAPVKAKVSAKQTVKATTKKVVSTRVDDLKLIEGIGPALEKLLNAKGIINFEQLSNEPTKNLEKMLEEAGPRFRVHVPETWAEQAKLLKDNKMDAFNALTTKLKGGRRV